MCGIVGYVGQQEAAPILLDGLRRLEYRGYDSAGIAVEAEGKIQTEKCSGYLENLVKMTEGGKTVPGFCGIGHTRWATHGEPSVVNAHPHYSRDQKIAVVHNGIIENYATLKEELIGRGHVFSSETDTEVIAYIIDFLVRKKGLTLEETAAVIAAPFWQTIEEADKKKAELYGYLRKEFDSLLITGPFSILVGFDGGMMALNDRLKLRSMVVGEKGDRTYFASEECAIRKMELNVDRIWSPKGGEPVVVKLER